MKFKFLLILFYLLGVVGCNKEDKPEVESEDCARLHYGQFTLINLTGHELAFNFPNGTGMDRYGVLSDSAKVTLDVIYSGWFNLSCMNIQTGEVKKYMITILDCNETVFDLR